MHRFEMLSKFIDQVHDGNMDQTTRMKTNFAPFAPAAVISVPHHAELFAQRLLLHSWTRSSR